LPFARVGADLLPIVHRIFGSLDLQRCMTLQLLQRDFDTLLELRVMALAPQRRIEIHFDIRAHAFVLHIEFPGFRIVQAPSAAR
jgi:hypothetical protein